MKNNTTQKEASAPSAAEIAAVVAAFKSATREEQLVAVKSSSFSARYFSMYSS